MAEREDIIVELWSRLSGVTGVMYTARNPKAEPGVDNLPAIQFFEMEDDVEEQSSRGGYPAYKRVLRVVVESFIKATSEAASSKEIGEFIQEVKKKVYEGNATLGRRCNVTERQSSRILRPPVGENVIGMGLVFELRYVETVSKLFA